MTIIRCSTLFGAFYLGFGITHAIIWNDIGAIIGASNSVWPWFKQRKELSNSENALPFVNEQYND